MGALTANYRHRVSLRLGRRLPAQVAAMLLALLFAANLPPGCEATVLDGYGPVGIDVSDTRIHDDGEFPHIDFPIYGGIDPPLTDPSPGSSRDLPEPATWLLLVPVAGRLLCYRKPRRPT